MSYPWFLDPQVPYNSMTYPTQSTAFGMSSLAAASGSMIAMDTGSQEYKLYPVTQGNRHVHNLEIIDTDKSPLGTVVRARMAALSYTKPNPMALTPPNKFSLSRDTLL